MRACEQEGMVRTRVGRQAGVFVWLEWAAGLCGVASVTWQVQVWMQAGCAGLRCACADVAGVGGSDCAVWDECIYTNVKVWRRVEKG
jgi:hypothetical protein